ncbi:uncharacterized protein DS421_1g25910 [Arachis hypogaea]|nr:uncharacterized protein DS421_1g25910 [Arachis hypogaea]
MPLRPIDNALPTTSPQHRPKKQPKISVVIKNQQCLSENDQNQVPLPSSGDATIDYISSENLVPISDPEDKIKVSTRFCFSFKLAPFCYLHPWVDYLKMQSLVEELESKNWTNVCESLNDVRRFALFHSSLLFPLLGKVVLVVAKTMKNPRSAVCKTCIMAASDVFNAFGDKLLDPSTSEAFDGMLLQLLLKASQDKRFVCEEADKALGSMVDSMTPLPLFQKLGAYVSHANLRVRAKAAISLSKCVSKMV